MTSPSFSVTPLKTALFRGEMGLSQFVASAVGSHVREKLIVAVTSKIVSLAEKRVIPHASVDKKSLVERESDVYLGEIGYGCHLTIKHGLLIPSAGIDESNSEDGSYILFPEKPFESAKKLWSDLRPKLGVRELGVIITDSHTTPLRRGVTGIALSYWGFRGVKNFVGHGDLFGRKLQMTQVNVADALATSAVFAMGEADERQPVAVIEGAQVEFCEVTDPSEIQIPLEDDLYGPLLREYKTVKKTKQ